MTVTSPKRRDKGSTEPLRQVTEWMNAARGLLLAAATLLTAITALVVALTKG